MTDTTTSHAPVPAYEPAGIAVQRQLPVFPAEALPISEGLSVVRNEGMVVYFSGLLPIFTHAEEDEATFRMFVAQLCAQGTCRQADIIRTLGVNKVWLRQSCVTFVSFRQGCLTSSGPPDTVLVRGRSGTRPGPARKETRGSRRHS